MTSHTTRRFRACLATLPDHVRRQARVAYRLFLLDPWHPGLRFKQVHPSKPVYSARVGLGYRALAIREGDAVIWFWIGSHAEYDRMIGEL